METSEKIKLKLPLEEIIDAWFQAQGVDIVWEDEALEYKLGDLSLILTLGDKGDISLQSTRDYANVEDFLSEFKVE